MRTYHKRRGKPDNSRDEAERFSCLPATASIVAVETTPVPDTAAAQLVNGVDKDTECGKPCKGDNDVNCGKGGRVSNCGGVERGKCNNVHGQEKNPEENGMSHIRPRRIDNPATTSV